MQNVENMIVVNKLHPYMKKMRLVGLKRSSKVYPEVRTYVDVTAETRGDGTERNPLRTEYTVSVAFGVQKPNGQDAYVSVKMRYFEGAFLKAAALDLGESMQHPFSSSHMSITTPIDYLRFAIGASIAARSEIVVSAREGGILVELVCHLPEEVRRGLPHRGRYLPEMNGSATYEEFKDIFRAKKRKRVRAKAA